MIPTFNNDLELYRKRRAIEAVNNTIKPYNEKLMELLVKLPSRCIFYSDRIDETYFFDGKWISIDELCELIFSPLKSCFDNIKEGELKI